jgi:hypothetical protein
MEELGVPRETAESVVDEIIEAIHSRCLAAKSMFLGSGRQTNLPPSAHCINTLETSEEIT